MKYPTLSLVSLLSSVPTAKAFSAIPVPLGGSKLQQHQQCRAPTQLFSDPVGGMDFERMTLEELEKIANQRGYDTFGMDRTGLIMIARGWQRTVKAKSLDESNVPMIDPAEAMIKAEAIERLRAQEEDSRMMAQDAARANARKEAFRMRAEKEASVARMNPNLPSYNSGTSIKVDRRKAWVSKAEYEAEQSTRYTTSSFAPDFNIPGAVKPTPQQINVGTRSTYDSQPEEPLHDLPPADPIYSSQPVEQYNSQPVEPMYNSQPVEQYNSQPVEQYNSQPAEQYNSQPVEPMYNSQPVDPIYSSQPVEQYNSQPVDPMYNSQPAEQYNSQPVESMYNSQPVERPYDSLPVESMYDSQPYDSPRIEYYQQKEPIHKPRESIRRNEERFPLRNGRPGAASLGDARPGGANNGALSDPYENKWSNNGALSNPHENQRRLPLESRKDVYNNQSYNPPPPQSYNPPPPQVRNSSRKSDSRFPLRRQSLGSASVEAMDLSRMNINAPRNKPSYNPINIQSDNRRIQIQQRPIENAISAGAPFGKQLPLSNDGQMRYVVEMYTQSTPDANVSELPRATKLRNERALRENGPVDTVERVDDASKINNLQNSASPTPPDAVLQDTVVATKESPSPTTASRSDRNVEAPVQIDDSSAKVDGLPFGAGSLEFFMEPVEKLSPPSPTPARSVTDVKSAGHGDSVVGNASSEDVKSSFSESTPKNEADITPSTDAAESSSTGVKGVFINDQSLDISKEKVEKEFDPPAPTSYIGGDTSLGDNEPSFGNTSTEKASDLESGEQVKDGSSASKDEMNTPSNKATKEIASPATIGGPGGSQFGGTFAKTAFPSPKAKTPFLSPKGKTAFPSPKAKATFASPKGKTAFPMPKGKTTFPSPKAKIAFPSPKGKTAFPSSKGQPAKTPPPTASSKEEGPVNSLDEATKKEPKQVHVAPKSIVDESLNVQGKETATDLGGKAVDTENKQVASTSINDEHLKAQGKEAATDLEETATEKESKEVLRAVKYTDEGNLKVHGNKAATYLGEKGTELESREVSLPVKSIDEGNLKVQGKKSATYLGEEGTERNDVGKKYTVASVKQKTEESSNEIAKQESEKVGKTDVVASVKQKKEGSSVEIATQEAEKVESPAIADEKSELSFVTKLSVMEKKTDNDKNISHEKGSKRKADDNGFSFGTQLPGFKKELEKVKRHNDEKTSIKQSNISGNEKAHVNHDSSKAKVSDSGFPFGIQFPGMKKEPNTGQSKADNEDSQKKSDNNKPLFGIKLPGFEREPLKQNKADGVSSSKKSNVNGTAKKEIDEGGDKVGTALKTQNKKEENSSEMEIAVVNDNEGEDIKKLPKKSEILSGQTESALITEETNLKDENPMKSSDASEKAKNSNKEIEPSRDANIVPEKQNLSSSNSKIAASSATGATNGAAREVSPSLMEPAVMSVTGVSSKSSFGNQSPDASSPFGAKKAAFPSPKAPASKGAVGGSSSVSTSSNQTPGASTPFGAKKAAFPSPKSAKGGSSSMSPFGNQTPGASSPFGAKKAAFSSPKSTIGESSKSPFGNQAPGASSPFGVKKAAFPSPKSALGGSNKSPFGNQTPGASTPFGAKNTEFPSPEAPLAPNIEGGSSESLPRNQATDASNSPSTGGITKKETPPSPKTPLGKSQISDVNESSKVLSTIEEATSSSPKESDSNNQSSSVTSSSKVSKVIQEETCSSPKASTLYSKDSKSVEERSSPPPKISGMKNHSSDVTGSSDVSKIVKEVSSLSPKAPAVKSVAGGSRKSPHASVATGSAQKEVPPSLKAPAVNGATGSGQKEAPPSPKAPAVKSVAGGSNGASPFGNQPPGASGATGSAQKEAPPSPKAPAVKSVAGGSSGVSPFSNQSPGASDVTGSAQKEAPPSPKAPAVKSAAGGSSGVSPFGNQSPGASGATGSAQKEALPSPKGPAVKSVAGGSSGVSPFSNQSPGASDVTGSAQKEAPPSPKAPAVKSVVGGSSGVSPFGNQSPGASGASDGSAQKEVPSSPKGPSAKSVVGGSSGVSPFGNQSSGASVISKGSAQKSAVGGSSGVSPFGNQSPGASGASDGSAQKEVPSSPEAQVAKSVAGGSSGVSPFGNQSPGASSPFGAKKGTPPSPKAPGANSVAGGSSGVSPFGNQSPGASSPFGAKKGTPPSPKVPGANSVVGGSSGVSPFGNQSPGASSPFGAKKAAFPSPNAPASKNVEGGSSGVSPLGNQTPSASNSSSSSGISKNGTPPPSPKAPVGKSSPFSNSGMSKKQSPESPKVQGAKNAEGGNSKSPLGNSAFGPSSTTLSKKEIPPSPKGVVPKSVEVGSTAFGIGKKVPNARMKTGSNNFTQKDRGETASATASIQSYQIENKNDLNANLRSDDGIEVGSESSKKIKDTKDTTDKLQNELILARRMKWQKDKDEKAAKIKLLEGVHTQIQKEEENAKGGLKKMFAHLFGKSSDDDDSSDGDESNHEKKDKSSGTKKFKVLSAKVETPGKKENQSPKDVSSKKTASSSVNTPMDVSGVKEVSMRSGKQGSVHKIQQSFQDPSSKTKGFDGIDDTSMQNISRAKGVLNVVKDKVIKDQGVAQKSQQSIKNNAMNSNTLGITPIESSRNEGVFANSGLDNRSGAEKNDRFTNPAVGKTWEKQGINKPISKNASQASIPYKSAFRRPDEPMKGGEMMKSAAIGTFAGGFATAPFAYLQNFLIPSEIISNELSQFEFDTLAGSLSGAAFALLYSYFVKDEKDEELAKGAIAAFTIARAVSGIRVSYYCEGLYCGEPLGILDWDMLKQLALSGSESLALFYGVALAVKVVEDASRKQQE